MKCTKILAQTHKIMPDSNSKPSQSPSPILILAGLLTIYLIWGSTYLAIRIAVDTIPPFLMASTRFLVAGLVLAGAVGWLRGFQLTKKQWRDSFIVSGFMILGGNGLVSWAETSVPSGIATLVIAVNPLFFVFAEWGVAWWRGAPASEGRPKLLTFVGLALGTIGLVVLVGPAFFDTDQTQLQPLPVFALVLACLCWTIGSLYNRFLPDATEPFAGSAAQMLCGSVWLLAVSLLIGETRAFSIAKVSGVSIYAWLYLVIAGSLIAYTTFVWLMNHASPSVISTYAYVNPIVAVFLGWLILNESVSPRLFLASAIIIAGVALITISKQRKV